MIGALGINTPWIKSHQENSRCFFVFFSTRNWPCQQLPRTNKLQVQPYISSVYLSQFVWRGISHLELALTNFDVHHLSGFLLLKAGAFAGQRTNCEKEKKVIQTPDLWNCTVNKIYLHSLCMMVRNYLHIYLSRHLNGNMRVGAQTHHREETWAPLEEKCTVCSLKGTIICLLGFWSLMRRLLTLSLSGMKTQPRWRGRDNFQRSLWWPNLFS